MEGLINLSENLHSSGFFNQLMKVFTLLGDGGFFWIVLSLILLCFKKTRRTALVMLISLAVGYVLNDLVLKLIIKRPRPFVVYPEFQEFLKSMGIKLPSGYSFPSGHAFSSFNCAVIICLFDKRLGAGAVVMAAIISFSRIFFCVHYPTDVLAGMILGIIVAICVFTAYKFILKTISKNQRERVRKRVD